MNQVPMSQAHRKAVSAVIEINLESRVTANLIDMFRNTLPSVKNYIDEVILEYRVKDETDFQIQKSVKELNGIHNDVRDLNFTKDGHHLIQTPEGFKDRYVPYLNWLINDGVAYIERTKELLDDYYRFLTMFISSKDGKTISNDNSRLYAEMEEALAKAKNGLGSFFEPSSSSAVKPLDELFDRSADIQTAAKIAIDLNRKRLGLKPQDVLKQTNAINGLLTLIIESSENDKIPEVSGPAASALAKGALVAAHYVEFVGVIQYRIEEAINAMAIAAGQINKIAKT